MQNTYLAKLRNALEDHRLEVQEWKRLNTTHKELSDTYEYLNKN